MRSIHPAHDREAAAGRMGWQPRGWPPVQVAWHWLLIAFLAVTSAPTVRAETELDVMRRRAHTLSKQGKQDEAIALLNESLKIARWQVGELDSGWRLIAEELAVLYKDVGRWAEAEPLFLKVLRATEQEFGPKHFHVGIWCKLIVASYESQGNFAAAEPFTKRAIAIDELYLGPTHKQTLQGVSHLAETYRRQGNLAAAEPLFLKLVAVDERTFGPDDPQTGTDAQNLALLYQADKRYAEAAPLFERALSIFEKSLGADHPYTASSIESLGVNAFYEQRYTEAERFLKRALQIREKALGPDHRLSLQARHTLAIIYRAAGREADAVAIESAPAEASKQRQSRTPAADRHR